MMRRAEMHSSKSGYTLIELMIVLSLIGILTVLGVTDFARQVPRHHLSDAGRKMISDFRRIRQKAIAEGVPQTILFDPGSRGYLLPGSTNQFLPSHIQFGYTEEVRQSPSGAADLPDDGISFRENSVTFQPNGTFAGLGGTIYLTNSPSMKETIAITVNMTGRIKRYQWRGDGWK